MMLLCVVLCCRCMLLCVVVYMCVCVCVCVCVHEPIVVVVVICFHCLFIMKLQSYDVVSLNDIDPEVCIVL